ncbi:methyl-accepting chemotaxis protein [Sporomusa acidovorans]|uniref:Methyl-accepting chemotaxis protein McpA n=1 Tax=Sporomusa acidovorans (strain ATCC 49682 / DSM 3132 / Mol) TaxID=1123286 RepID=A0ABZ3IYP5_SPOA4|nr:methyl-accepting chemotaxis protein [Sporomusa acidovorans]OZC14203.1 methyl-accepting chemotaxis protein McpA [Sporomusa acidovorans DSM 3132]SDE71098.1 methyl-accepting chemotaxis sensory transducer with Cache sensor [Sporomusa acidovorans]
MKIQAKLTLIIGILFTLSLGGLAGLNYWQAKNLLVQDVKSEFALTAERHSEEIASWLDLYKTEIVAISRTPVLRSGNAEAIRQYLAGEVKNNSVYETMLWFDVTGMSVNTEGVVRNDADREHFKQAMQGKTVVSDPLISKGTGKQIVVIATPVKVNGAIVGAVAGVVDIEALANLVEQIKVADTGYAFVARSDGMIMIHPNKELAGKVNALQDPNTNAVMKAALAKMVKGEKGFAEYQNLGVDRYVAYAPIRGTSWAIAVVVPVHEITGKLTSFTWTSLLSIFIVLILAVLIILRVAVHIARPLKILQGAANRIAGGDLTLSQIAVVTQDELGSLARSFENMVANLRQLVQQISDSSGQLTIYAQELTTNTEQSAQAANQVAGSITETAHGAEQQVNAIGKAMVQVKEIADSTRRESEQSESAMTMANNAVAAANEGNKAVSMAIDQMGSIQHTVDASARVVTELGEYSKKIGKIVETISGIAGQTNLLALNAAIEAARAGEQGRGFAVVAEEVRKLAEQSQEAAKQIAQLIGEIQGKTTDAVNAMENGTQEVRRGSEVVNRAGGYFQDIDVHIRKVAGITQKTAEGMNKLAENSNTILKAMEDTETFSRDISSQSQTISAATEEQSASMEEIASSSQHLAQLSKQLQNAVARFHT